MEDIWRSVNGGRAWDLLSDEEIKTLHENPPEYAILPIDHAGGGTPCKNNLS